MKDKLMYFWFIIYITIAFDPMSEAEKIIFVFQFISTWMCLYKIAEIIETLLYKLT